MPINTDMFARIEQIIEANPEQHWQKFFETLDEEREGWSKSGAIQIPVNACGTTRCVAGWAVHLWGVDNGIKGEVFEITRKYKEIHGVRNDPFDVGQDLLGLTEAQAGELFYNFSEFSALKMVKAYARGEEPEPVNYDDEDM